jgi:hypothetical protein
MQKEQRKTAKLQQKQQKLHQTFFQKKRKTRVTHRRRLRAPSMSDARFFFLSKKLKKRASLIDGACRQYGGSEIEESMETRKVELFPVARSRVAPLYTCIRQHTSAYVSIRQHTSAYVSIRQHTSAYVEPFQSRAGDSLHYIHMHTSAYVSIRQHTLAYVAYVSIRQHTSAYFSMRQHTSACVEPHWRGCR